MVEETPLLASGAFWLAILGVWFALSVVYRRASGKPLMAGRRPDAVFAERWTSVRIGSGLLARLSTARNCMHVQVTDHELHIHPHFPFTVGFMPELYGLDKVVPLDRVRSAAILGGNRTMAVEVVFQMPDSDTETAQLLLRGAEPFIRAVLARQVEVATPRA